MKTMNDSKSSSERTNRPLFIAPIDIHENDEITLLFGEPALIMRGGIEIWRDEMIPEVVFDALIKQPHETPK